MIRRPKLPAYARVLLEKRRAGEHPLDMSVVYGDRWRDVEHPMIALDPDDYEPRKFDFHVCAGLHVTVVDQLAHLVSDVDESVRPYRYGKFFALLAEIAASPAYVTVRLPSKQFHPDTLDLRDIAWGARRLDREENVMRWPEWWSDAAHAAQLKCFEAYVADKLGEQERGRRAAA